MPTLWVRFALFLSAYFPLTLICFILFAGQQPLWAGAGLLAGSVGCVTLLLYFFRFTAGLAPTQLTVNGVRARDADAMSYVVSYVVPFVAIPFNGWQQAVALLVFALVLGVISVSANLIYINPCLNLVGFRVFDVSVEGSQDPVVLIARGRVRRGDTLLAVPIGAGAFLQKGRRKR